MPGRRAVRFSLAAFVVCVPGVRAQQVADYEPAAARGHDMPLTIRSIMRGPELVGQAPQVLGWSDDGEWVYFRWLPGGRDWHADREIYRVSRAGGAPERLDEAVADTFRNRYSGGDLSPDRDWRVRSVGGDLILFERPGGAVRRLTDTRESESAPRFSADGSEVFFVRDGNAFGIRLTDGRLRQLTDIRDGPAEADEPEPKGHQAFLRSQQSELFEHIRTDSVRDQRDEDRRDRLEGLDPEPLHPARGERVGGIDVDPTGNFALVQFSKPADDTDTMVPRWITETGYTEESNVRSKVGDQQGASRIALVNLATGEASRLELAAGQPEPNGSEASAPDSARAAEQPSGDPDLAVVAVLGEGWNDGGTHALLAAIDADYKSWRLYALDGATAELTLLEEVSDEAWVGGPCGPGFGGACAGWMPGGGSEPRAWFVSERSGWAHLYTIAADGSDRRQVTDGEWEVHRVSIPPGWDAFLLHTSETSRFDRHPWRVPFDGGARERLAAGSGWFNATLSPDGERMAVVYSTANRPPELYLADVEPEAELEPVTRSPTEEWLSFPWIEPEIVHIDARDGARVPARLYRPEDLGADPSGAGVIFVHGAGYLQNVHNWWSNYFREYMFHHLLAARGYTVLDIDYRGSAGHGRDWRTAIYRHMGGWDLSDQVDGARWLVENAGVDPDRVGIYGGSYGGFITLMALFTQPQVFAAGAALRSVTDWAHYNHWYTSRILNLPHDDEEAYRQSSPIYFAEGLEGHLLIAHGMYDTNVHFSDVVRLAQRLIELGKEDWEMAVYPVENHGFVEPTSWTDEYRRIFELFERSIGEGDVEGVSRD